RHTRSRHGRRAGRGGAGRSLPHELRGGAEAHRRARASGARGQAEGGAAQAGRHSHRKAQSRSAPARQVRGAVARTDRAHDRAPRGRPRGAARRSSMSVTDVRKDPEALTMTVTCEFAATPERVWRLWADPRQLERWWGPPEY